jgi:hypothetical protein
LIDHQEEFFMKKLFIIALVVLVFAGLSLAQTYTEGTGITGIDKLGAHQNGGRGCVGCHTPHSGSKGNGGNALGGASTDDHDGNVALWGQDMQPLYGQLIETGSGAYDITFPANAEANEDITFGIMTCLSCHDGNLAKGAMMTNQSFEQSAGLLPLGKYGPNAIPTLLGADGTPAGNYKNDHPIGPQATLGAVGIASRLVYQSPCGGTVGAAPCLQPNTSNTQLMTFISHYGLFNITQRTSANPSAGRTTGVVLPTTNPADAYLTCITCHTPHTMHLYSGSVRGVADIDPVLAGNQTGVYPSYFFIAAPYNPGADVSLGTKASSATQFCRQCHFTGAGGSNEGSNVNGVDTQF